MKDKLKTKERLIGESVEMRQRVAEETERKRVGKTTRKAEEYTETIMQTAEDKRAIEHDENTNKSSRSYKD
jgi:hypothetical protein